MLQTPAIKAKAETPTAAPSAKDKDPSPGSLEPDFSSYFSKMMAAAPAANQGSMLAQPVPTSPPPRPPSPARQPVPAASGAQTAAAASAAGAAQAAAAGVQAPVPAKDPQPVQQHDSSQGSATGSQAQGTPSAPGTGAKTAAPASGTTQTPANGGTTPGAPLQAATPPAPPGPANGTAPGADAQSAAKAKDALAQAYPGGNFQTQFGDAGTAVTNKPPLTEFTNQIQMDPKPGAEMPAPAAEAAAAVPAAAAATSGLALAASLPAAQVAGAASLLAVPLATGRDTVGAPSPLAGNLASAQAVGAAAAPGAASAVRVTAPNAGQPALATQQQSPMAQVDGTIRWLVKNNEQGAELQLHPESLGRVQIKLKVEGNVVHAKLWASEAASMPALQEHRSFLEASLKQQGLTLGSFDLQHGHRDDQAPLPAPSQSARSSFQDAPAAGQESPAASAPTSSNANRIEYVA